MAGTHVWSRLFERGNLVQVNGMNGKLAQVEQIGYDGLEVVDTAVDGWVGVCLGLEEVSGSSEGQRCSIRTFDGRVAAVPASSLQEYHPADPEDGGFDALWPCETHESAMFASSVVNALAQKGYCVIQMPFGEQLCQRAAHASTEHPESHRCLRTEMEVELLGLENRTKTVHLPYYELTEQGSDTPKPDREEGITQFWDITNAEGECTAGQLDEALSEILEHLDQLGMMVSPWTHEVFGYSLSARSAAFARVPFLSDAEEQRHKSQSIDEWDVETGTVEKFVEFTRRRKLLMLLLVECEGGEVRLTPRGESQYKNASLPASGNKLVLFRHDELRYSYRPEGESIALQAWLMSESIIPQQDEVMRKRDEPMVINGPTPPPGRDQAHVMAGRTRLPGSTRSLALYWNMFTAGSDLVVQWPLSRWDEKVYYAADRDTAHQEMKSYTNHGGFMEDEDFNSFDNQFFDYTVAEAKAMAPGQRMFLEVGCLVFQEAGITPTNSAGRDITICCGDVGADWGNLANLWHTQVGDNENPYASITGQESIITPSRLSLFFSLTGPTYSCSTACSASLVAMSHAHHEMLDTHRDFMVGGLNTMIGPTNFCAFCQNNMLSQRGRCFTYNEAADGFTRGEGVSAHYVQWCDTETERAETHLACLAGTFCNQDGRSASLTAPHGPSQLKLAKSAMRISGLTANEVCTLECHGTGTALGDPIEVGALEGALKDRSVPVYMTSAKSVHGHLESGAGLAGFSKCVALTRASACPPNCHLVSTNPHLKTEGFPCFFTTELSAIGYNSSYAGVSSFGATGTNARAEVIAKATIGPWTAIEPMSNLKRYALTTMTCPNCLGDMCRLCGAAVDPTVPQHLCSHLRDERASYDLCSNCHEGGFRHAALAGPKEDSKNAEERLFIIGSWNAFSVREPMLPSDVNNRNYTSVVTLGDLGWEQFQIVLEGGRVIYPVKKLAGRRVRIVGPDAGGTGMHWMLDGRADCAPAGTSYRVTFSWGDECKRISWERESPTLEDELLDDSGRDSAALEGDMLWHPVSMGTPDTHRYFVTGSYNTWALHELKAVDGQPGVYETKIRIGYQRQEEFQIVRDKDRRQVLYPAASRTTDTSVPIMGPDDEGDGMSWAVIGEYGRRVRLRLRIRDGDIRLSIDKNGVVKTWHSAGPLNDWQNADWP